MSGQSVQELLHSRQSRCFNCYRKTAEMPLLPATEFTVGIHPAVLHWGKDPVLRQYPVCEWTPFISQQFIFCPDCAQFMANRIIAIVSQTIGQPPAEFLGQHQPNLIPGLGHFLTLSEYLEGRKGRYFNFQVTKQTYRKLILDKLPPNITQYALIGAPYAWA